MPKSDTEYTYVSHGAAKQLCVDRYERRARPDNNKDCSKDKRTLGFRRRNAQLAAWVHRTENS